MIELQDLLKIANNLHAEAMYIVDSFGSFSEMEITNYYQIYQEYLHSHIAIGLHAHNNLENALNNAEKLIELANNRNVYLDCSLNGIGRGGGKSRRMGGS